MINENGVVNCTHYQMCKNYTPNKSKPTGVVDSVLGMTYECERFEYASKGPCGDVYQKEVDAGCKLCLVCIHFPNFQEVDTEADNWAELCGLIKYYIFENQLDDEFLEVAQKHFELTKKIQ